MKCSRSPAKPYLDGQLDDPIWRTAPPQELQSRLNDDKTWRATVQLACDEPGDPSATDCQVSFTLFGVDAPLQE